MQRTVIISAIQSIAIIGLCTLLGLSFAYMPEGNHSNGPFFALAGAVVAAIALFTLRLLRGLASEHSERMSPLEVAGGRLAISGLVMVALGWLTTVFLSVTLGRFLAIPGVLIGVAGIIVGKIGQYRRGS
jgi:hypothetical protein